MISVIYLGDIMGRPGRRVVQFLLPELRKTYKADLVIAQAENVSHGKGMSPAHMRELQKAGIDFFSGGNHTIERAAALALLDDKNEPVIAPINQAGVQAGWGAKIVSTKKGDILIASVLGTTFPNIEGELANPLQAMDTLLASYKDHTIAAKIINFHGDWSSEKRVIGYYLDGRASAVIGDHWHVPTADAMVLPKGTAHITDVGMCGTLHSSLGVTKEIIIDRWRHNAINKNEIAEDGPYQLNAVHIEIDETTGLASNITPIQRVLEKLS